MNLITAILKSIPAILTGTFWTNAFKCIALTILALIGFIWAVGYGISSLASIDIGWLQSILGFVVFGGSSVIAWFLFPAILPLIASFFQDGLLNKLEEKEYNLEKPSQSHSKIGADILFVFKVLGINILLLPVFIFPPVYFILYYVANGYMLGTEFFRVVSDRRIERQKSLQIVEENKLTVYGAGMLITFFANIPVINVVLPLVAVILMMHVFYTLRVSQ